MKNEFLKAEIKKIFQQFEDDFSKQVAYSSLYIIAHYKGFQLKIYDVRKISSLADYFVIGTGTNTTQIHTMAEEIATYIKAHGGKVRSKEGLEDAKWVLVDLGDVVVHIFDEASREVYDLDGLWKKAPTLEIPEYFFTDASIESQTDENTGKGYF